VITTRVTCCMNQPDHISHTACFWCLGKKIETIFQQILLLLPATEVNFLGIIINSDKLSSNNDFQFTEPKSSFSWFVPAVKALSFTRIELSPRHAFDKTFSSAMKQYFLWYLQSRRKKIHQRLTYCSLHREKMTICKLSCAKLAGVICNKQARIT
jgi:hypothetical protein